MCDKVPVLFITFNRLDTVKQVFAQIQQYKPNQLFLASDGSRNIAGEDLLVKQVQDYVTQNIDWPCEIQTQFLQQNLGPAKAVSSFVKWFFKNVEYGIILEHDCLPHQDFFPFCEQLLHEYKDNKKVFSISGFNVQGIANDCQNSYYFSNTHQYWGWAGWKRTVKDYDIYLTNYSLNEFKTKAKPILKSKNEYLFFKDKFLSMKKQGYNTWDMQLLFNMWKFGMYNIEPKYNLISNIGFGTGAVHCKDPNSPLANVKTYSIMPLQTPPNITVNEKADEKTYMKFWYKNNLQLVWRWFYRHFLMKKKF